MLRKCAQEQIRTQLHRRRRKRRRAVAAVVVAVAVAAGVVAVVAVVVVMAVAEPHLHQLPRAANGLTSATTDRHRCHHHGSRHHRHHRTSVFAPAFLELCQCAGVVGCGGVLCSR